MDPNSRDHGTPEHFVTDRLARANAIATGALLYPPSQPNVLCRPCQTAVQALGPRWKPSDTLKVKKATLSHHVCVPELLASASSGCHLCAIFAGDEIRLNLGSMNSAERTYHIFVEDHGTYILTGLEWDETPSEPERPLGPTLIAESSPKYTYVPLISARSDSHATFEVIQRWIGSCMQTHKRCTSQRTHQSQLPHRLIEISLHNGELSTRLRNTKDFPKATPYVCLSHCWGGISSIKLIQSSEESLYIAIPLSDLPQSFIDAVAITTRLGYNCLWIDSLCIIQDSKDDWSSQIPLMGEIYGNSAVTIAASKSKNSNGGCFTSRNPLAYSYCKLPGLGPTEDWFIGTTMTQLEFGPSSRDQDRVPLLTRGWVVQEWAQAPRTISFGSVMVHWECIECTASEMEPALANTWIPRDNKNVPIGKDPDKRKWWHGPWDPTLGSVKNNLAQILSLSEHKDYMLWQAYWWEIVETYTACELTYKSDKLPAISSLAARVKQNTGLTFSYGLWREHMYDELLWSTTRADRIPDDMPSWSWLSLDGGVTKLYHTAPNKTKTAKIHWDNETSTPAHKSNSESQHLWSRSGRVPRSHVSMM